MQSAYRPVILVTGAGRGLGRGITLSLARAGFSVAVNYAGNVAAARETIQLARDAAKHENQQFFTFKADIGDASQRTAMVDEIVAVMGRLDALVNNAGIGPEQRNDVTGTTEQSFDLVLRTNLNGPFFLTQDVVNRWLTSGEKSLLNGGYKVVFVTSISSHTASLNRAEYCISKAGLSMAAQVWSLRLAGEGIQVYEVRPGIMATDMTAGVRGKYDALIEAGVVPQKRWGTPDDVGLAVQSLLEGNFLYSTGTVIDVDGGFHLRRL